MVVPPTPLPFHRKLIFYTAASPPPRSVIMEKTKKSKDSTTEVYFTGYFSQNYSLRIFLSVCRCWNTILHIFFGDVKRTPLVLFWCQRRNTFGDVLHGRRIDKHSRFLGFAEIHNLDSNFMEWMELKNQEVHDGQRGEKDPPPKIIVGCLN